MSKVSSKKGFIELFAGIGLVRMGLEPLGWNCLYSNDINPFKESVYRQYFKDNADFVCSDVWDIEPKLLPKADLFTVSFPCIDLSNAGARAGLDGTHSGTFWAFIRILKGLKKSRKAPKLIMVENVLGFLMSKNGADLRKALEAIRDVGYRFDCFVLDARHFVPQSRPRFFIVAISKDYDSPVAHALEGNSVLSRASEILDSSESIRPKRLRDFVYRNVDLPWVILDLPSPPRPQCNLNEFAETLSKNNPQWWSQDKTEKLLEQMSPTHRSLIEQMRERPSVSFIPFYRRIRNGGTRAEGRFDGLAGCLRTARGGSSKQILAQVGKGEFRARWMTGREYARLQGVKDSFPIPEKLAKAVDAFGDAVCVPAISWIAGHALEPLYNASLKGRSRRKQRDKATMAE